LWLGFASFCSATATAAGLANPDAHPHVGLITTNVVSLSGYLMHIFIDFFAGF